MVDLQATCEMIKKATKGFGTDEKLLIDSITSLRPEDLPSLENYYKSTYGTSLDKVLKTETSGHFGHLLRMCVRSEAVVAAEMLHQAMTGIGCDVPKCAEVLVGRSNVSKS